MSVRATLDGWLVAADRIAVIHQGRVVAHDELVAQDGRYASMFRVRARHGQWEAGASHAEPS